MRLSWAGLVGLGILLAVSVASASTRRVEVGEGEVAAISDEHELWLEAAPLAGEGLLAFSRRLAGDEDAAEEIARVNGNPKRLLAGVRYRVPWTLLAPTARLRVLGALFPEDRPTAEGWEHVVSVPGEGPAESLWHVARWFTGEGNRFVEIRERNGLEDDTLRPGQKLRIPADLLVPALAATLPPVEVPYGLEYTTRDGQQFAVYRLKAGEALYSSVVVRFTGRTEAEFVNALAAEIADLNGIPDVTDMAIGQSVRIPFDLLLPEFLPPSDPRRLEYARTRSETARYSNEVRTTRLEGITVILDAGHGGQDPGAMQGGVWESTYVYDIMLRVKRRLEATTAARVVATTREGADFRVPDQDQLPRTRSHVVLTEPAYALSDPKVGVNLRWYLANSLHRRATSESGDSAKTVFLSLHADSLHPSLRGAMAYIPATSLVQGEYGKSGTVYSSRREVRERPRVSFSWKERTRSEGLSRQLATEILDAFRTSGLRVHNEKPIRDRIIRCRRCRPFVPAVIRYNAVPAKLLLEVGNLNNSEDRALLQRRDHREEVARAIVDGILAYYGEEDGAEPARLRAR